MNGVEVLRIVDAIHRDKSIDPEIVFEGIEQAILSAARKYFGEEEDVQVSIHRENGEVDATLNGEVIPPDELGRIAAQTAKQVMIQKIREAERDALFDEYEELRSHLVNGAITRLDHGIATVNLGKVEALLPRSEQIPGESHRVGERVRCTVIDVRKQGSRVKIILSRSHPDLVRRLFEVEIPEVNERIIEVRSLAREAGYRSKVAVSCFDNSIDAVGACVGVRGSRIKNIVEELAGERIDIVRWNDSLQVLIPNALQPAEVEDVILCPMLGRVIVLVRDDQLSLAIGKKGQNVRLASKLVGWDIEVMTREELDEQLDRSVGAFSQVPHVTEELAEALVSQGFFSFEDLSVIEPDQLLELSGLTQEQCDEIVEVADRESIREEKEADERRALNQAARQAEREAAEMAAQAGVTEEELEAMAQASEAGDDESPEIARSESGDQVGDGGSGGAESEGEQPAVIAGEAAQGSVQEAESEELQDTLPTAGADGDGISDAKTTEEGSPV
ncbi:MAG: transcription termination factor NusA [Planctomycetaceae bacterium]|nr:transcription termination factor NusA [Planctomycetaceae bacterium]